MFSSNITRLLTLHRPRPAAGLVLLLALLLPAAAPAQEPVWLETHSWKGSGTARTEIFWANTSRWRIRYRPRGKGLFQISVYNVKGELVDVAANQAEPLRGMAYMKEKGEFFLAITGADTEWEVSIEQFVNMAEEWQLRQRAKLPPPAMWKIATWTGGAGRQEYDIDVPHGSWQIVHSNHGPGLLQIQVFDQKGDLAVAANNALPGSGLSWLHTPGRAKVAINAVDTAWKIEVFCEAATAGEGPR